jgi:hypothetical protein
MKIKQFEISKKKNILLWVCFALCALIPLGFNRFLLSCCNSDSNALLMLFGKIPFLRGVFSILSTLAYLTLLECLWHEFRKIGSWLNWLVAIMMVVTFVTYLLGLFPIQIPLSNDVSSIYVILSCIHFVYNISILTMGIVLLCKFKGWILLYGISIIIQFAFNILNDSVAVSYGDYAGSFPIQTINYCVLAASIFQLLCLKMTMRYAANEDREIKAK